MFYRDLHTYSTGDLLNEFTRAYLKGYQYVAFNLIEGYFIVDIFNKKTYKQLNLYGFNPLVTFRVERQTLPNEIMFLEQNIGVLGFS